MLSICCFTAAALVKPVALLWLPLIAVWLLAQRADWPSRLRWGVAIVGLFVLPAVLAYMPFWAGAITFRGLLAQSNIHGNTLPSLFVWVLWSLWPHAKDLFVRGVKLLTVLVFAPFYAWQLWRVWRSGSASLSEAASGAQLAWSGVVQASFDVMLFYLLFVGFQFWPWYLAWLMAPAALLIEEAFSIRRRIVFVLCVLAPLLYFPFGWPWFRANLPVWGMALVAALPLIGLLVWLGVRIWPSLHSA